MSIKQESVKTISSIFIMPTIRPNISTLKAHGYIASYGYDSMREIQYEDAIYAVFKPKDLETFNSFLEKEYKTDETVIDDYNYDDTYVVIVYKQLPEFKSDYDLIKQGKYSKTSEKFQKLFPKHVFIYSESATKEETSIQYKIFNKTPDLAEYWKEKTGVSILEHQEYWTIYDKDNETLKLENGIN